MSRSADGVCRRPFQRMSRLGGRESGIEAAREDQKEEKIAPSRETGRFGHGYGARARRGQPVQHVISATGAVVTVRLDGSIARCFNGLDFVFGSQKRIGMVSRRIIIRSCRARQ